MVSTMCSVLYEKLSLVIKLYYRQEAQLSWRTAQCAGSVEILKTDAQLYEKSYLKRQRLALGE